jgi:hypothetical protein
MRGAFSRAERTAVARSGFFRRLGVCFSVSFKISLSSKKPKTVYFALVIRLRDDDSEILNLIQKTLQIGTLCPESKHKQRAKGKNVGDQMVWQCHSLLHHHRYIVPFFKRYPLRTKKARDFEFWSQAVELAYLSYGSGTSMPDQRYDQIIRLKQLMETTRAYSS